ncbi:hypothetical protein HYU93_01340 [Candidatus Daviesbacteria bacterium]|nr:hypothetical protein [Candidatus Daviesbacteria bacterium]
MLKKNLLLLVTCVVFLLSTNSVFAAERDPLGPCEKGDTCKNDPQGNSFACQPDFESDGKPKFDAITKTKRLYACLPVSAVGKVFGIIQVPGALGGLIGNNPTGAGAISQFLTNFIALLFSIAGIVLVFMFIWAAFEWITSGGDKEKIASAQKRILHAIIGILLFAVAFVIIRVLGIFTGFTFFKENIKVFRNAQGQIERVICSDGTPKGGPGGYIADPAKECQGH